INNHNYWGVGTNYLVATINSAALVEELCGYLLASYPERFALFEHAPVDKIILKKDSASLLIRNNKVDCKRVVLCTNGFENLDIINDFGHDTNAKFHQEIRGVIGYMAGYKESSDKAPGAFAYFDRKNPNDYHSAYFYLTRRPYSIKSEGKYNLVCIGGPEQNLEEGLKYNPRSAYPEYAKEEMANFIKNNLTKNEKDKIEYRFFWHGLMGYTRNGLRMVGAEPCNKVLLYNLGCNGVGILSSIFGGHRIGQIIAGKRLAASIFDPFRQKC
ncbi:FAD-binding oxidoreductase, partial [Candidatus Peregrinibacteria bacterium]|nr:FAD-binding oxidoreductase [Candidatus Peregrinibacteria bacterium]